MADEKDEVRQLARTLQTCLELTEPVQQIQLFKKVGFFSQRCKARRLELDVLFVFISCSHILGSDKNRSSSAIFRLIKQY